MKYLRSLQFDFVDMLDFSDRPFRAKFVPAKIWDDLDFYKNDSKGLSNYFKKWKCKVVFLKNKKEKRYIPVGGLYDPDTNSSEVHIYTLNYDNFKFDDQSWDRLKYKLIQVTMHELIHCKQYMGKGEFYEPRTVKFHRTGIAKVDDTRHYYSGMDEIEAYAHCIFLDFKTTKPTIPVMTLIRRAMDKKDSSTFSGILKVFSKDFNKNAALPILAKKILTWERKYKVHT